ncbi:MAG TPA: CapA family protein [Candidatus Limnocylindrales bacterium]|nr:CapA family protein [Candidatus Limnocylindrales bacterium]
MDDDIRSRFRGARGNQRSAPAYYGRPKPRSGSSPSAPSAMRRPQPAASSQPRQSPVPDTPPDLPPAPRAEPVKRKRKKGRALRVILFGLILIGLAGGVALASYEKYFKKSTPPAAQQNVAPQPTAPAPTGTIRLVAIGDNLAFESINNAAKQPGGYDYLPLMSSLKPFFEKSDIRLCNESTPAGGESLGISTFPNFNAPAAWSAAFANVGCNVMNLGSDHTNDKGQPAIDAMLAGWDAQKNMLAVAGANRSAEEQSKVRYFEVKGVKFAFLSYTTRTNNAQATAYGINMYTDTLAKQQIEEAHKNADFVLVSMSWGNENSGDISADQDRIAQSLASYNADVVVGVGPHVVQPVKVLNGSDSHQTLVWYSLGNFISSQVPVENLIGGMAIMDIDVATQQIKSPKLLPYYMHYEWTAAQKKSQSHADLLARHDFKLYPLDQADEALARSQNGTTVQAQTERVKAIITKFVPIGVIKSTEF